MSADDYFTAYDALLERWRIPVVALDVPGEFGTTRVNVCGPEDAEPLVLIHGGRTSSPGWFANAAELARGGHRVYAIDTMGDPGRSVNDGPSLASRADLMRWLDELIAALGFLPGRSAEPYLRWESRGAHLDQQWLEFQLLSSTAPTGKLIAAREPSAEQLSSLTTPTLILLARNSRVHDVAKVERAARRALPHAVIESLPGVSHHMIPFEQPEELNRRLLEFLA